MTVALENTRYYLVIDGKEEDALFLFLGTKPSRNDERNPQAARVTLELLPPQQRFGGAGGVAMGMPVMGRWPVGLNRFRQFLTVTEMQQAGWVPVPRYRICDSWEDCYSPWSCGEEYQSTNAGSMTHEDSTMKS